MAKQTFYQFALTYRGKKNPDDNCRLADYLFLDDNFPKHSVDYEEISSYLEWNSPFSNALIVFDEMWEVYRLK